MHKKTGAAFLCLALLLTGCSTAVPSQDNEKAKSGDQTAQELVEQFNVIQNQINDGEYESAFSTMFQDTLNSYNNNLEMDAQSQGKFVEVKDNALTTTSADRDTDTVTFIRDKALYIITDQENDILLLTRYNDEGGESLKIQQTSDHDGTILNIGGGTKDIKSNAERQEDILAGFFKMNPAIAFNPVDNPDYYEFTNSETGTGFVCSMDIKDLSKFNADAKTVLADFELDGTKMDEIYVSRNYFDVDINNEGVIQNITNVIEIKYTLDGKSQTERYSINTEIYTYDFDGFNTSDLDTIFTGVANGTLKDGSDVILVPEDK